MADNREIVTVKVTHLKKLGYGIRIWVEERLWSERVVKTRRDIGPSIAADLRMIDKCGIDSPMAFASRYRSCR